MNKINELINKLCPNGVEYKTLDKICSVNTGEQLNKAKLLENAKYPVINGGINPSGYWNEYNTEKNTITISQGGASAGFVNYIETPFWAGAHCYIVKLIDNNVNYRYLYHFIKSIEKKLQQCQQGAGIPSVSRKAIYENCIPVPPMEVQNEIVHILDDFTLLSAELSAELKARQKQYEYYSEKLLNDDCEGSYVRLGDITKIITKGTTPKKFTNSGINFIKTEAFEGININKDKLSFVDEETHTTFLKRSMLEENDILFTIAGATIGKMAIVNKELLPANTNQALAIIRLKDNINTNYIKFILQSSFMKKYIKKCVKGSAQPNLNLQQLNDFVVPFPSNEKQIEIMDILEKFEKLSNDIFEGLPAEIEARQKQYEYYRDKLLTFKKLKVEN